MAPQFIKSARRGKPTTWYVYAYKGGPRIMKHVGPRRPSLDATASRKLSEALFAKETPPPSGKFMSVVRAWLKSPEWDQLASNTKKTWRTHVDRIEEKWGNAPTPDRVRGIRKVYVDESRARMALAARVGAKQKAKQNAK